jgi:hypothetical protein
MVLAILFPRMKGVYAAVLLSVLALGAVPQRSVASSRAGVLTTRRPVHDGRLKVTVELCAVGGRCSPLATKVNVTVLAIHRSHGKRFGAVVAERYAEHGRVSFVLPPGRYVPGIKGGVRGLRCLMSEEVVRADHTATASISCRRPMR